MTKYQAVEEWVKEGLRTGRLRPGDMLPSEAELCGLLSVGRNSVRDGLKNLVHAGYVETKKGIGTFCLSGTSATDPHVGFVCFFSHSYIFPRIVQGCNKVLYRNGYHLLLNESEFDLQREREILQKLKQKKVAGIIVEPIYSGSGPSNLDLLREIEAAGIAVVLLDNYFLGYDFTSVAMDDRAGGRLAASYLLEKGHTKIGLTYDRSYYPKILRMQGATEFLSERGITIPQAWAFSYEGPTTSGRLYEIVKVFFASKAEHPTAFVCASDEESIDLMKAAEESGLEVPNDISIVSFDNSSLAELPRIGLTSLDHPGDYMGDLAATLLLEKLRYQGVRGSTTTFIQPTLVERTSVLDIRTATPAAPEQAAGHGVPTPPGMIHRQDRAPT